MTTPLTKEDLMELGRKVLARREKDKVKSQAVSKALRKLREAHPDEYKKYLEGV